MPEQDDSPLVKGHPVRYGIYFDMKDPSTWGESDVTEVDSFVFRNGCLCQVEIGVWHNVLMRDERYIPMHEHPFALLRIRVSVMEKRSSNGLYG
jgi:hypothetical protein